jgi:hypothetical protein
LKLAKFAFVSLTAISGLSSLAGIMAPLIGMVASFALAWGPVIVVVGSVMALLHMINSTLDAITGKGFLGWAEKAKDVVLGNEKTGDVGFGAGILNFVKGKAGLGAGVVGRGGQTVINNTVNVTAESSNPEAIGKAVKKELNDKSYITQLSRAKDAIGVQNAQFNGKNELVGL